MSPWLPLIYQYLVGGFFLFGGIYIALRSGGVSLACREDRSTIIILIVGYFSYLAIHTFWIWKALA